jgi:hypothetical protein
MVYAHPGSDLEVQDWTSASGIVKAGGVRHVPEVGLLHVVTGACVGHVAAKGALDTGFDVKMVLLL